MSEHEMTRRVLAAMDDPHLAILGHPTGRMLLQREPYAIDLDQVLAKAAARGIAVEVNADPHRLDLDWRTVRRCCARGGYSFACRGAPPRSRLTNFPAAS